MAFNSQLLNFYRTDSYAICKIVFAGLFYIIISKPISSLSDKTRRKNLLKKNGSLSVGPAFSIMRTKCMQNKNELQICGIVLQMIALLKVYKHPGPSPSGISDLRQCFNFEVQKRARKQTPQNLSPNCKYIMLEP